MDQRRCECDSIDLLRALQRLLAWLITEYLKYCACCMSCQGMGGFRGGDGHTTFVRYSISAAHNRLWRGDHRYVFDDGVNSTAPGRNQTTTIAYTSIIPTGDSSFAVVYNMDRGGHWAGGSSAAFIIHATVLSRHTSTSKTVNDVRVKSGEES